MKGLCCFFFFPLYRKFYKCHRLLDWFGLVLCGCNSKWEGSSSQPSVAHHWGFRIDFWALLYRPPLLLLGSSGYFMKETYILDFFWRNIIFSKTGLHNFCNLFKYLLKMIHFGIPVHFTAHFRSAESCLRTVLSYSAVNFIPTGHTEGK